MSKEKPIADHKNLKKHLVAVIDNLSNQDLMDLIGPMLLMADKTHDGLHWYGQTPDWYVAAAYLAAYGEIPPVPDTTLTFEYT